MAAVTFSYHIVDKLRKQGVFFLFERMRYCVLGMPQHIPGILDIYSTSFSLFLFIIFSSVKVQHYLYVVCTYFKMFCLLLVHQIGKIYRLTKK